MYGSATHGTGWDSVRIARESTVQERLKEMLGLALGLTQLTIEPIITSNER